MVTHTGTFSGMHGTLQVADPILRNPDPSNSGVKIALIFPNGAWIETGWTKQANYPWWNPCTPFHYWAKDPGIPTFLGFSSVGKEYRYTIALADESANLWRVRIVDNNSNQIVFERSDILPNSGDVIGDQIQAFGEVGATTVQDMGISGMLNLKFRKQPGSGWLLWNPPGRHRDIPYWISDISSYSFQVGGNQGEPGFFCQ